MFNIVLRKIFFRTVSCTLIIIFIALIELMKGFFENFFVTFYYCLQSSINKMILHTIQVMSLFVLQVKLTKHLHELNLYFKLLYKINKLLLY